MEAVEYRKPLAIPAEQLDFYPCRMKMRGLIRKLTGRNEREL